MILLVYRLRWLGSLLLTLILLGTATVTESQESFEPFRIEDIRIEGLQRVSPGIVFADLLVGVDELLNEKKSSDIIYSLFATGNFDDVRIGRAGDIMVITVVERPFINDIEISGNKAINTNDLLSGLEKQGLSTGQVLKRATLEGIRQELRRQYSSRGRYDSDVVAEITQLPRNRVSIALIIDEGNPALVSSVNIIGNKLFTDKAVLPVFESRNAGGILGYFGKKAQYSRETLSSDLDRLESFYRNRGYLAFSINSVQVSVTHDRKAVFVGVSVEEKEQYKIKEINFFGDLVLPEERLRQFVLASVGSLYSEIQVTNTEDLIKRLLNNEGYLNAEVRGDPEIVEDSKDVILRLIVTPGKRTYVRKIEFTGNSSTKDEVLRREMRQLEGSPASRAAIDISRVRLQRLRFIKGAEIETVPVADSDEEIDLEVEIEEQSSGNIIFSLGYNETYGALYSLSLQRDNFFGTGRGISVELRKDRATESFGLNFVEPYFTADGISRSFNLYSRKIDLEEVNVTRYATESQGVGVNFGYPLSEVSSINFGFAYDLTQITAGFAPVQEIRATPRALAGINQVITASTSSPRVTRALRDTDILPVADGFLDIAGDKFDSYKFSVGWGLFKLNRGQLANRGYSHSVSFEASVPGSDLEYYKLFYRSEYFVPLGNSFTLRAVARIGYGDGYGDNDRLPFFEHFFAGGLNSVRGYDTNSLGPRSTPARRYTTQLIDPLAAATLSNVGYVEASVDCPPDQDRCLASSQTFSGDRSDPFGGNVQAIFNFEILFPLPFAIDQRSVRAGFFLDIGNVFDSNCNDFRDYCSRPRVEELRASAGVGLVWITAFGPLNFSFARPLNERRGDDTDTFEFSIGTGFGF